ncbi:MAG: gamma-glutamyltransferase family protein [Acidobacteria bacterium]|nr:gamma-glutamyltransferase family protein [Acidobacteriota bacterium]
MTALQPRDNRLTGRSVDQARHGMVATSQPLAVRVGVDILQSGGSAVDAAIAVNAALGLMEPMSCGIGGDLFAIVWDAATRRLYGLNASGPAPGAVNVQLLRDQGLTAMPPTGPFTWTIPGCVAGWAALHRRFGRLPLAELLAPAIRCAEEGFPVTKVIAAAWQAGVLAWGADRDFSRTYAPAGRAPAAGEIFANPLLAATYRLLAEQGPAAFYDGPIASVLADYSKRQGGFLRRSDLAAFRPEWVAPRAVRYRGHDVWQLPPNGQGLAVLQMLAMLERMDLAALGCHTADYLHTLIEIKKIVYEDRARFYADPRFFPTPVDDLLSAAYTRRRLALLQPDRAGLAFPAGDPRLAAGDTVYLTVVDEARNAVSLIQSIYQDFGSGLVPAGLGFCLQNRGALFSLDPDHPNALAPGKRPFHTIIPALVSRDGDPVFVFGVMGGAMQPQGQVQILSNILDFGMDIQAAGDAPRFRHDGSSEPAGGRMTDGGTVILEEGISPGVGRELAARGHRVVFGEGGFGGYQGIWIDARHGMLSGASESRKDGCALGY